MNVTRIEIPESVQDVLTRKEAPVPLALQSSRSFAEALATARSRTVSKAGGSSILSSKCGRADDMNEIELCQTVCR
jgi:hypothetical protein